MSERAVELHGSPWIGVFHVTGGGSGLLAELLQTPGASKTVLAATIPYAAAALTELLGRAPDQACSPATARQLAMAAFERARQLHDGTHQFGLGCTASLATDRQKKGTHRAHWAIQTATDTFTFAATYSGDRAAEEHALVEQIWSTLRHCLLSPAARVDDAVVELHARATPELAHLLGDDPYRHCIGEHDGRLLLPGSFNPLHDGHREMLAVASELTGLAGAFELAIRNADKPSLDFLTLQERIAGTGDTPLWLTNTPTFEGKAELFPGVTFALGVDTLARIGQLRFYRNHVDLLDAALDRFVEQDTHFLVFGRKLEEGFMTLGDLDIPTRLKDRCTEVPESVYRNDVSSTEIRKRQL